MKFSLEILSKDPRGSSFPPTAFSSELEGRDVLEYNALFQIDKSFFAARECLLMRGIILTDWGEGGVEINAVLQRPRHSGPAHGHLCKR
jgi:hypothetical protein